MDAKTTPQGVTIARDFTPIEKGQVPWVTASKAPPSIAIAGEAGRRRSLPVASYARSLPLKFVI